jgi:hypothetical protein
MPGRSSGPGTLAHSAASIARIATRFIGQRELLLWLAGVLLLNQLFWEAAQTSSPVMEVLIWVMTAIVPALSLWGAFRVGRTS